MRYFFGRTQQTIALGANSMDWFLLGLSHLANGRVRWIPNQIQGLFGEFLEGVAQWGALVPGDIPAAIWEKTAA